MKNHTQGEWKKEPTKNWDGFPAIAIKDEVGFCLAIVAGYQKEEMEAKASMIVAAPKLLEALERALPSVKRHAAWLKPSKEAYDMAGPVAGTGIERYNEMLANVSAIESLLAAAKVQS